MTRVSAGRWMLRVALVAAIGGLFVYVTNLRKQDQVEAVEQIRLPVVVARPSRGTVTRSFVIGSYVESEQTVTITPEAAGALLTLDVDVGDRVRQGQLIGQIDPEPYRLALEQSQSAADTARSTYERTEKLHEAGSASDAALDQVRAQFDAAETALSAATLNLEKTEIRSPVTGLVMARHRSAGEVVAAGVPIVTVSNTADLLVTAEVPESFIRYFVAGRSPVAVRPVVGSLPDAHLGARIRFVSPYIRTESRTFRVACEITGDTAMIVPGMYVELEFVLEEKRDVLTLPFGALVAGKSLWFLDPDTLTVHSMEIEPGLADEQRFVVPDSLADRWFIVDGQHFLSEGLEVRVINGADIDQTLPPPESDSTGRQDSAAP